MEIPNRKKAILLAVSLPLFILLSCSQNQVTLSKNYSIAAFKTMQYTSYGVVSVQCLDMESRDEIPCAVDLNGVILLSDSGKFEFNLAPGKFRMTLFFLGKKKAVLNKLIVEASDSIKLTVLLEDDNSTLHGH